jgi:hypothetical protein
MDTIHTAAATYVQISRDELEDWLNTIGYRGKWERDPRYAGTYLIELSPTVGVKLSSTIGSRDDAMGRGKASMQLALVSLVTGKVLNKKAQGQSHFKRTTGWKKTWATGIETMKKAYLASADFYDVISVIEDRDKYRSDLLEEISTIAGWSSDAELAGFYRKVEKGGVLMPREQKVIEEAKDRPAKIPDPQKEEVTPSGDDATEAKIDALRKLWVASRRSNDDWTMRFAEDIATKFVSQGRNLSAPQIRVVVEKLKKYRVPDMNGDPAFELF